MRRLLVLSLPLLAAGCPSSEDVLAFPDAGLSRLDIVLPGDDVQRDDFGQPIAVDTRVADPDVEVECVSSNDCALEPGQCEVARCKAGACVLETAPDGAACNDNNACTETKCDQGVCVEVSEVTCNDDGNPCTTETCKPDSGCASLALTGELYPCDDGDACTGNDYCVNGACIGTPACALGTADNPAKSCLALHEADATKPSGVYFVQAGAAAVTVYCEMSTEGGGWTRIGVADGTLPLCNLAAGIGTAAAVQAGTGTAFLPAATVAQVASTKGEIMGRLTTGGTTMTMVFATLQWATVASGETNSSNSGGLQVSLNGGTPEVLSSIPVSFSGPAMLGGKRPNGKYTFIVGVGAQKTGAFVQDAACTGLSTERGFWGGDSVTGFAKWAIPGELYVR